MRGPRWLATLPLSLAFHVVIVAAAVAFFRMDSAPPGLIVDLNAIIAGRDDGPEATPGSGTGGGAAAPRPASRSETAAPQRAPASPPVTPRTPAAQSPRAEPVAPRAESVAPRAVDPGPAAVPEPSAATAQTTTPSQPAASSQSPAPSASAPTSGAAASAEAGRGSSSTDRSGPTQPGAPAAGSGFGTDGPGGAGRGGDQIASLPPGAGGVGAEAGSEYAAYLARLRQRIQEVLRYPPAARRRSVTGTVQLEIAIAPDGAISSVSVVASSSHEILDRAALDAARSLSRVPFPSDVRPRSLRVRLPVVFELQ